ncbi:MAG: hypothetical protein RQ801_08250 [Spirochaetaceae bacterium]|nr:hypothetical protein [Spirochaetaceae bacterium]MDT8298274.1 hypothetical protein [Spirochaetaceae bacterium]
MKRLIAASVLVLMALNLIGAVESFGNARAENRVLIAKENTRYKSRLIDTLIEKLDDGTVAITVADHQRGELDGLDPRDFDAVFITNSGAQAKVRPDVMRWLNANSANDDNVVLHTTQITDWDPPVQVDSITSASKNSNIDDISDDIIRRIRLFF